MPLSAEAMPRNARRATLLGHFSQVEERRDDLTQGHCPPHDLVLALPGEDQSVGRAHC